jgi:hypothetical protein
MSLILVVRRGVYCRPMRKRGSKHQVMWSNVIDVRKKVARDVESEAEVLHRPNKTCHQYMDIHRIILDLLLDKTGIVGHALLGTDLVGSRGPPSKRSFRRRPGRLARRIVSARPMR